MNNKTTLALTGLVTLVIGLWIGMSLPANSVAPSEMADNPTPTFSAYVGLLDTEIRGLDQKTIEGFQTGKGVGQALPAELNGYPGPRHTLDMAEELELTDEQFVLVQALFDDMQSQAVPLGLQYLEAVAELELAFREGTITLEYLESQLGKITAIEAQLRYVHLSTHLATIDILNTHQITQYNLMRGYSQEMNHEDMQHSE